MPRYAMVVVVDGDPEAFASRIAQERQVCFVTPGAEVPVADEYSAERIEMYAGEAPVEVMPV